jgi:hypothetical protein
MGFMFGKTIVVGPLEMTVNRLCYDSGAGLDFAIIRYEDRVWAWAVDQSCDGRLWEWRGALASRYGKRVKFAARSE